VHFVDKNSISAAEVLLLGLEKVLASSSTRFTVRGVPGRDSDRLPNLSGIPREAEDLFR
jgi:hypothetical protein